MTHLKYLLPNYERGDRYLRKICQRAHRFTHPFRLCNDPAEPGMKLAYGYLGNIARHARRTFPKHFESFEDKNAKERLT